MDRAAECAVFAHLQRSPTALVRRVGAGPAVPAAVSGAAVGPVGVHSAAAVPAAHQAGEQVGTALAVVRHRGRFDVLGGDEVAFAHQGWMHDLLGHGPLAPWVPASAAVSAPSGPGWLVVRALAVPDLPAGVARVGQDLGDRAQRPRFAAAVLIPLSVVSRRAQHTVVVQLAGDARRAQPGEPPGEDQSHDRRGCRVGIQPVQPPAPSGVRGVRVWTGIDQPVPVRWPAAQVAVPAPVLAPASQSRCGTAPAAPPASPGDRAASRAPRARVRPGPLPRRTPGATAAPRARPAPARARRAGNRRMPARTPPPPPRRTRDLSRRRPRAAPPPAGAHPWQFAGHPDVEELGDDPPVAGDQILSTVPLPPPRRPPVLILRRSTSAHRTRTSAPPGGPLGDRGSAVAGTRKPVVKTVRRHGIGDIHRSTVRRGREGASRRCDEPHVRSATPRPTTPAS